VVDDRERVNLQQASTIGTRNFMICGFGERFFPSGERHGDAPNEKTV